MTTNSSDGDVVRVFGSDLSTLAKAADTAASTMTDRYAGLADEVASLLDEHWTGAAADACRAAWNEWADGFRLVIRALQDEARALHLAGTNFVATDSGSGGSPSNA